MKIYVHFSGSHPLSSRLVVAPRKQLFVVVSGIKITCRTSEGLTNRSCCYRLSAGSMLVAVGAVRPSVGCVSAVTWWRAVYRSWRGYTECTIKICYHTVIVRMKLQKKRSKGKKAQHRPILPQPTVSLPQNGLVSSRRSPPVPDRDRRPVDVETQLARFQERRLAVSGHRAAWIGTCPERGVERLERVQLERVQPDIDRFQHRGRAVRELKGDSRGRSGVGGGRRRRSASRREWEEPGRNPTQRRGR